jgi:dienelactone hydrolase
MEAVMWKKRVRVAAGVVLLCIVLAWAHKARRDAHYFDGYAPGAPLNAVVLNTEEVGRETPEKGHVISAFTFDGCGGEKVPALISLPMKTAAGKLPVIIFLHGIGQSKSSLRQITPPFNQCGFAFVTFDQYMQGERKLPKKSPILTYLGAFRDRPAKTVNETRRLIDYLLTRPDIDPQRIYLLGASYGAVMGSTVLAKDKRVRAGVLTYGGGNFSVLLDSYANHIGLAVLLHLVDGKNINPEKPPLPRLTTFQECAAWPFLTAIICTARYFMSAADPINYVADISPTPVYFQNGLHDVMVPAAAGLALQKAAGEPQKVAWYDSDHVGINLEQTKQVLADALRWLLEQDDSFRTGPEKIRELPPFEMTKL